MMKLFSEPPKTSIFQSTTPPPVQSKIDIFSQEILPLLLGKENLTELESEQIKEEFKSGVLKVCENVKFEISKSLFAKNLVKGDFDEYIFAEPPKNIPETVFLIEHHNRLFMQRLFFKCKSQVILDFWLNNGVKISKDGLAQAIRLKSDKIIFQQLEQEGYLSDINSEDTEMLIRQAKVALKDNQASLNYLIDVLEQQNKKQAMLCQ